jgi:hypothetical protein
MDSYRTKMSKTTAASANMTTKNKSHYKDKNNFT